MSLTGPEVCELVFGKNADYDDMAGSVTEFERSDSISELTPSLETAVQRAARILRAAHGDSLVGDPLVCESDPTLQFMRDVCDRVVELYRGRDDRLRVFIGWCGDRPFGIFANPIDHVENMVRVRTLDMFEDALNLFERLGFPLLSLVDTPGADPRVNGENRRIVSRLVDVAGKIIAYPHARIGIVSGRAYGGASILGFPKVFGGLKSYALDSAHVGIMHSSIIGHLLKGSPRMLNEWSEVSRTQRSDMQDMVDAGALDAVIKTEDLRATVENELLDAHYGANAGGLARIARPCTVQAHCLPAEISAT